MRRKIAEKYLKYCSSPWGRFRQKVIFSQLTPFLKTNKKVLDLGCGPGFLTTKIAKNCKEIIAVDHNEMMLKELRNKKKEMELENLTIIKEDALNFLEGCKFKEKFDLVICHNLLEYIDDKKKFLTLIGKNCNSEALISLITQNYHGELLLNAKNNNKKQLALLIGKKIYKSNNFQKKIKIYTPKELKCMIRKLNWNLEKWLGVGVFLTPSINNFSGKDLSLEMKLSQRSPYRDQALLMHFICSIN
ncbi:MAG: class I SAM-dependent methyltransferase [Elusimicrobiota bacterium]